MSARHSPEPRITAERRRSDQVAAPIPVTDPGSIGETQARMREIGERQAAAARRQAEREADRQAAARAQLSERARAALEAAERAKDEKQSKDHERRAAAQALAAALLRGEAPDVAVREIIAAITTAFGLTAAALVGRSRCQDVVRARFAAIHAVRRAKPHLSLPQIGRAFGRDHTTILNALRKMERDGVPQPPAADGPRLLTEATAS